VIVTRELSRIVDLICEITGARSSSSVGEKTTSTQ
jgi:hypothetical protein